MASIRPDGILDPKGKYPNPLTGKPYSKAYFAESIKTPPQKGWSQLDAWSHSLEILKMLHKNSILLLVLPTGVGKTVIVPKLLLHYFGYKKAILCTTPRTASTESAGEFSAKCLDVPLYHVGDDGKYIINKEAKDKEENKYPTGNKIVGYKHSGSGNTYGDTTSTMLLFTTDGTVKQMLLGGDKDLSRYGGILIDEAHERSVNIDILMALVLDIIPRRPDFKVVIMSATIDNTVFTNYFKRIGQSNNYSVFEIKDKGTTYPIDFKPNMTEIKKDMIEPVYNKVNEILLNPSLPNGDIIAFVTSAGDINKLKKKFEKNMKNYPVDRKPYFIGFTKNISDTDYDIATKKGSLTLIKPNTIAPQGYSCKLIISTPAAESSITFSDPLRYVIDTGYAFEKKYSPKNYCYESGKFTVSQSSIMQRCGRTGRNNPGICYQLYTTDQFDKLPKYIVPKILLEDFTQELLGLIVINGNLPKAYEFIKKMIEPVENYKDFIVVAYQNLINMALIDKAGNLTPLGDICTKFNIYDIKIAKMIIGSYYLGCMPYCMMLAAIISTVEAFDDVFKKLPNMEDDQRVKLQYTNNIKRFINPYGDHITLLIIFFNFISSPDKEAYANQHLLDFRILTNIQKEYQDVEKLVRKLIPKIKMLNLFGVPDGTLIFGGGKSKESNLHDLYEINNLHVQTGGFDTNDNNNTDDNDSSDDSDSSDYTDDYSDTESNKYTFELQTGGRIRDSEDDTEDDSEDDSQYDSEHEDSDEEIYFEDDEDNIKKEKLRDYEEEDKIDYIINNKLPNLDIDRGINNSYSQGQGQTQDSRHDNNNHRGGFQNFNSNNDIYNKNIKNDRSLTIKNSQGKHYKRTKKQTPIISGGANDNSGLSKHHKIINLIDLKDLKPRMMIPPDNIFDKVLSALFYGYSNNIACYTGSAKKYYVKYSPNTANISKSSLEYINKTPDYVIYNEFNVNKDMGAEGSKLVIVSEINMKHIGQFIDLNELAKKLI